MEKMMEKHPHKVITNQIHSEKTSQTLKQADEGIKITAENILKNRVTPIPQRSIRPNSNLIKPEFFNIPLNIFKEKKVWITSLIALICLMSIYGVSFYNGDNDNLKITNKIQKTIPKLNKTDVSENLTLSNVNILFDKKSSIITKENYAVLQKIVDTIIKSKKNYSFSIEGYSCDLGSNIYNDNLSKLRAKNIKTYLAEKGLDSSKIKISWFGETKFTSNGNLENCRKMSRNVIIKTKE